jgi:hypothetical protein
MYTQHHSAYRTNDPMVMLARCHMQDLERDIARVHLAKRARAARPGHRAPLPALLQWLRGRLVRRSRSLPAGTPPAPFGGLASTSAGQP